VLDRGVGDEFAQAAVVGSDGLVDGGGQVLPEVESVGDLDCTRCAQAGPFCVGARAVAADDLDTGVFAQPAGESSGLPVRQDVDRPVAMSIRIVP
jgi:hypothetical protein